MADRNLSNVIRISKSKIINFSLKVEDTTNIYWNIFWKRNDADVTWSSWPGSLTRDSRLATRD